MIELLVGMIASGKSTYCKRRAAEGAIITNDDNIVKLVHGDDYTLYNKRLKPLYKLIETAIIHYGVSHGFDVVVDRTNLDKKMRARYIGIAQSLDTDIVAVVFPVEQPKVHVERRMRDARGLTREKWMEAATAHFKRYEPVELTEGFKRIIDVLD